MCELLPASGATALVSSQRARRTACAPAILPRAALRGARTSGPLIREAPTRRCELRRPRASPGQCARRSDARRGRIADAAGAAKQNATHAAATAAARCG
eukprot:scaffold30433_cov26-Tisochrysis_lutea.AAC.3